MSEVTAHWFAICFCVVIGLAVIWIIIDSINKNKYGKRK
jgi:hypothetical protein